MSTRYGAFTAKMRRDFKNHPFKVNEDAGMIELKESIEKYGILTPIVIRPVLDGYYEIISGHSQVNMVTDVYSHILDEDRRKNAELFAEAFYEKKNINPTLKNAETEQPIAIPENVDPELLMKVLANPEMVALLTSLAKSFEK